MKVLLAVLASATFACGGKSASTPLPLWSQNPGGTTTFEPTLVDMSLSKGGCGGGYSADLVDLTGPPPNSELFVSFPSPAPALGNPHMLAVGDFSPNGSNGSTTRFAETAAGDDIFFGYSQGSASEIDLGAYDAVTVTILAMPTDNGQPMTVSIEMHFVDGKVLNETFSNLLVTELVVCVGTGARRLTGAREPGLRAITGSAMVCQRRR